MSCCNSNCNHDPCGSSFNQALTKAGQYAQYAQTQANKAEDLWLEFNALYLGAFAVAPTQDNQGNPLQVGALYWNTASNELYTWTGLAWYLAPGFDEFTPFLSTGSTTPRNLATRFADVVNVKDFGAVGDGVTDDTAAIQAAVNAAARKCLFFPAGNYLITAPIIIGTTLAIVGEKNRVSIIIGTPNINGFVIGDGTLPTRALTGSTYIGNIDFNPKEGIAASTIGACIKINYTYYTFIDRCTFYGKDSSGIKLNEAINADRLEEGHIFYCEFLYVKKGIVTSGVSSPAERTVSGRIDYCKFYSIDGDCIYFGNYTEGMTVNFPIAVGYTGDFIHFNGASCYNHFIIQPDIEIPVGSGGIYVENGASVQVIGGWFGGQHPAIFVDNGGSDVSIQGVLFNSVGVVFRGPACTIQNSYLTGPMPSDVAITIGSGASAAQVVGNRIRFWNTGISVVGTPEKIQIQGNTFQQNTTNIFGGTWSPAVSDVGMVEWNNSDAPKIVAAATNTVLQIGRSLYQILGATPINTISLFPYGARIVIQAGTGGITINNSANIVLRGGVNATVPQFSLMEFISDGTAWIELSRNF